MRRSLHAGSGVAEDLVSGSPHLWIHIPSEITPLSFLSTKPGLRARLGAIARGDFPSATVGDRSIDAFISHGSEDREAVAAPLADDLIARGFTVWLDQYELKIGDSVYGSIDSGLRRSRFGVVILSPHFFAKNWPQRELHALAALGAAEGSNKILPVWHNISHQDIASLSPLSATVFASKTSDGIGAIADHIAVVLRRQTK